MLKGKHATLFFFAMVTLLLFTKTARSIKVTNCQVYSISISGLSSNCSECTYGYDLDESYQCSPKAWVRIVSLLMLVKYLEPFVCFRSILTDFMGEFWFFTSNQSHSSISKKLTQFIITINNERLWPYNIKENFQFMLGKQRMKRFHNFLGTKQQMSQREIQSIKRDLFLFQNKEYSFTSPCVLRLVCSSMISLSVWIGLQFIQGFVFLMTGKRVLQKKEVKGSLVLMVLGQFYQFVGFYGFYQIKQLEGYHKFGMKINILVTVSVIFVFLFTSMCLLPIIYYLNQSSPINTTESHPKHPNVHRVLTFANNPSGYFYYLIHGYFRQFCTGCIIGYFYDQNFQYILLALWYIAEYLLLDTDDDCLTVKIYFAFRKGFVFVTVFFLLLMFQENVHIFSHPDYSFQQALQISLCLLYIFAVLELLLNFVELAWKLALKIQQWLINKNKTSLNKSKNNQNKNEKSYDSPASPKRYSKPQSQQKASEILNKNKGLELNSQKFFETKFFPQEQQIN